FGLAKLRPQAAVATAELSIAATVTTPPVTAAGSILGTLHYMSPEQLEGLDADVRSDIFALGALLHEMLSGQKAFDGTSAAGVTSPIMSGGPPPISTLQPSVPASVDYIIRSCLHKVPDERCQSIHDVKLHLQWLLEPTATGVNSPARWTRGRMWLIGSSAFAVGGIVALLYAVRLRAPTDTSEMAPVRFMVTAPADESGAGI